MQITQTITGSEPLTASEVKNYLKIDFSTDDTLINMLITGVREQIEEFTGLALIAKTIVYFDEEIADEIKLPYPAHDRIMEVQLNGVITTSYYKTGLTQFIIKPNDTQVSNASEYGIKITYTCSGVCPTGIKIEMLKLIDEKYRNRGNTFEGAIADLSENCYANLAKFCVI
jgi:uncharacterized phiE125 gp8 family phage protein